MPTCRSPTPFPEPVLRIATAADAQNLAALAIQVWLHTYATNGIRSVISQYVLTEFTAEAFMQKLNNTSLRLFVAEVNDHLVAYALVNLDAPCPTDASANVELTTLYVQEHFGGVGLGSKLLSLSQGTARERPVGSRLWLTANAQNMWALAFYAKHRFVQAGTIPFGFGGESHLNHILIEPCA